MIVCFDTETTGISEYDELLQITVIDDNEKILLETYLKPQRMQVWKEAEKVNHITWDMVKDAPSPESIKDTLQDIFDRADKVIGYNTMFDVGFVERCCKVEIDREKIVDCLKDFRAECRKKNILIPHHKLGNAVDYYCPEAKKDYLENAHDASCDAIATMRVYLASIDETRERNAPKAEVTQDVIGILNMLKSGPKTIQISDEKMDEISKKNSLDEIDTAKVRDWINEALKEGKDMKEAIAASLDTLNQEYDQKAQQEMDEEDYYRGLS